MDELIKLQSSANAYAQLERRHYIPNTSRREDDACHSLSVALLCWHFYNKLSLKHLSEAKILKYALIHDLVEIYAGDTNTYASSKQLLEKDEKEEAALKRLRKEFSHDKDFINHLIQYQNKKDQEAWFVWGCDKVQAYLQGYLDNWRAYLEYPVSKDMFMDKISSHGTKMPTVLQKDFADLSEQWISSYPDR